MTGTCTLEWCSNTGQLVPWRSQRLCLPCTDIQLDMLAIQLRDLPVTVGKGVTTPGHVTQLEVPFEFTPPPAA